MHSWKWHRQNKRWILYAQCVFSEFGSVLSDHSWFASLNKLFHLIFIVLIERLEEPDKLLFVRSRWGRKLLVYERYVFFSNKRVEATNTTYWRCTFSSNRKGPNRCSVRCITRDNHVINFHGLHNHPEEMSKLHGRHVFDQYSVYDPWK